MSALFDFASFGEPAFGAGVIPFHRAKGTERAPRFAAGGHSKCGCATAGAWLAWRCLRLAFHCIEPGFQRCDAIRQSRQTFPCWPRFEGFLYV